MDILGLLTKIGTAAAELAPVAIEGIKAALARDEAKAFDILDTAIAKIEALNQELGPLAAQIRANREEALEKLRRRFHPGVPAAAAVAATPLKNEDAGQP